MDFTDLAQIGAEPTPTDVSAFIVSHLEAHGPSRRGDLIQAVEAAWLKASGTEMRASSTARVKKALSMLAEQGVAQQTGRYGIWALSIDGELHAPSLESVSDDELAAVSEDNDDVNDESPTVEREIGTGDQLVYCFYLDVYRELAEAKSLDRWPVKIGMTTGPLESRMATHRTALPEDPRVELVIRSNNGALLEKIIHGVLTLRGHRCDGTGGTEWFSTNCFEIEQIYYAVVQPTGQSISAFSTAP